MDDTVVVVRKLLIPLDGDRVLELDAEEAAQVYRALSGFVNDEYSICFLTGCSLPATGAGVYHG